MLPLNMGSVRKVLDSTGENQKAFGQDAQQEAAKEPRRRGRSVMGDTLCILRHEPAGTSCVTQPSIERSHWQVSHRLVDERELSL
jgi:hypothetical protein